MKKNFMYKFLISSFILMICSACAMAKQPTFVSLSPALTEIMYSLNAQDMLKGVSTACNYPNDAKNKEKIGDNFFINEEKIMTIKPDYILAIDSTSFMLQRYKKFGIKPLCFQNQNIKSILNNIVEIGKLTHKEKQAQNLISITKNKINKANKKQNKKILYLVQTTPMISIGEKSFITDIIQNSGNISITSGINSYYPTISEEFAIIQKPDIIVLSFYSDTNRIKKLFPNTKIVFMTKEQNDIINRPGPRIYKSVEFFAGL